MNFVKYSQFTDKLLLHILVTLRRGRHNSADQIFCALCRKAPANLSIRYNLSSQVLSVISRLTSCATRVCCACVELPTCVAERYLTLRTGCERHGRKNPLPFPYFAAVTCRQSAPDSPREKGRFTRGWKTAGCLPSCAPARR